LVSSSPRDPSGANSVRVARFSISPRTPIASARRLRSAASRREPSAGLGRDELFCLRSLAGGQRRDEHRLRASSLPKERRCSHVRLSFQGSSATEVAATRRGRRRVPHSFSTVCGEPVRPAGWRASTFAVSPVRRDRVERLDPRRRVASAPNLAVRR